MIETDVLVVGGGAAGLAVTQALARAGVAVRLAEGEAQLGGPWRRRHKHLTLNSYRDLSVLPGVSYPAGTPAFPNRAAVISLFEDFARLHKLPIDYSTAVERIDRAGERWEIKAGDRTYRARHVIVATGRDRVPFIPDWPGLATFPGRIVHAADFGEAEFYRGRSVLVAGAGNSGIDVLNHLIRVETGPIWLSARHALAVLPKRVFNIAVHKNSAMLARLPLALADLIISTVQRLSFGDLSRLGLPKSAGGPASRLAIDSVAIATDDGAVAAMKAGRIKAVPEIKSFDGTKVVLEDGCSVEPDVVIAATGYRTGLESMVGHLGVLDQRGKPLFNGGHSDPKLPGLWFTGMRADLRGCFMNAIDKAEAITARIVAER
ncbi:NAD(P)/FAD-dependent oxidoreductase [Mesorhizobium sp. LHD-90]|uniref:flavin-containing monooxygenase n=1 Tax=Mesorhizobium sp. LHD-90 TaxID=3071414 RepID=UPI0027E00847|nr:NAD(P)/FAD-dependent oxidoreductase [Mesorhizobium sp. LHD-90]MDQ6436118.1 NAD(P)/FAD-dependent oxidoreductase [Mesorhizobium sp. LHD-90]